MKSTGKLRYSPKLLGSVSENWWIIVDCDPQIGGYYRNLFHLNEYKTKKLNRPSWEAHITVVRNEEPPHKEFWKKYAGELIEFEYNPEPRTNGEYWWFDVECPRLFDIRTELGLKRDPEYSFHLSIGHT